jgi:two-component system, LytTR family, sensor kinase
VSRNNSQISSEKSPVEFSGRKYLLIFGGWTLLALFFSCQSFINYTYAGRSQPFLRILTPWLVCSYLWALLTPLVLRVAERFPIEKDFLWKRVGIHLLFGSLISLFQIGIYVLVFYGLISDSPKPFLPLQSFQNVLVGEFHFNLLLYFTVVGLWHVYDYYNRFRERERRAAQLEVEAAQLETQLANAQLDALKMQLHPHFLFNTLNTISVLMQEDVTAANRMLVQLSELLRVALKNTGTHEITLRQELEFLRSYLEIEQTRFQDRLKIKMEVAPETLDAKVPNLILQPLVENCIRHAVAPRACQSEIEICAVRSNGHLELLVRDDGDGIDEARVTANNGIGLSNTRARLEKLYGAEHKFELSPVETGGLQISISIPFHVSDNLHE